MDNDLEQSLDKLTRATQNSNSLKMTFLRGIFSGFGVFIGSVLLAALFLYILSLLDTTPIIGRWIAQIVEVVDKSK